MRVSGNYRGFGFGLDIPTFTFGPGGFNVSAGGGAQSASRSENFPDEFFKKYPPNGGGNPLSLQDKILLGGLGVLIVGGGLLFLKRRSAPSREG
jgi:hypothetical protein